jgi:putative FmdB family regulatory protein
LPLFEYECRKCGNLFEHLVYGDAVEVVCRKCGSADIVQLHSTFAVRAESGKAASQESPCASCQGMQGGMCRMNPE